MIYTRAVEALKEAGFTLVRNGIWESGDGNRGVALSNTLSNASLARSLLRSAGVNARL